MWARHPLHGRRPASGTPARQHPPAGAVRAGRGSRLALLVLLVLLVPAATAGAGAGEPGWGPFQFTNQSFLHTAMFDFQHEAPAFDAPGSWRFSATVDWANVWEYAPDRSRIDGESWTLRPALRFTPREGVDVRVDWPLQHLGGGVMDHSIEAVHRLLGLGSSGRTRFPRNQLRVERFNGRDPPTVLMDDSDTGWYRRAPVLSARLRLTPPEAEWPVALKAAVDFARYESPNPITVSRGHDWGIGLSTAGPLARRWATTLSVAHQRPRSRRLKPGAGLAGSRTSVLASLEHELRRDSAFVVQLMAESGVTSDTLTALDRPTADLLLGWKWRLGDAQLELALLENVFMSGNNADFGLHLGYRSAAF